MGCVRLCFVDKNNLFLLSGVCAFTRTQIWSEFKKKKEVTSFQEQLLFCSETTVLCLSLLCQYKGRSVGGSTEKANVLPPCYFCKTFQDQQIKKNN